MQYDVWEKEYQNPVFLTRGGEPQNDVLRFLKFLKKECGVAVEGLKILDLGSGTGRNTNYLAELGNEVVGMEISDTAIKIAKSRLSKDSPWIIQGESLEYIKQSIGVKYPFPDNYFDLILDITSSNSLNEKERGIYLSETNRVLKTGGYFFVKALCKEGDKNAKFLLKNNPGKEHDTYLLKLKEHSLQERVFNKEDFVSLYSKYFKIINLDKKTSYTRFANRSYKRNFWLAYMQK